MKKVKRFLKKIAIWFAWKCLDTGFFVLEKCGEVHCF